MRRLAQRLVADAAERDDVVQAAWMQALVHASATQHARPWLAAVVRNVAFMGFRSEARREIPLSRRDAFGEIDVESLFHLVRPER